MKSELLKTTFGFGAIIVGLVLVFGGVRLGTDPELEFLHRAAAAGAMTPAGVLLLRTSFRVMKKSEKVMERAEVPPPPESPGDENSQG